MTVYRETWSPPALAPGALRALVARDLREERRRVTIALVALGLSGAAVAAGPSFVRSAIDDGIRAGDVGALRTATLGFLAVLVLGGIASGVRSMEMTTIGQRVLHRLRSDSLAGILRLDLGAFERARRGDLQARVTADVEFLTGAVEHLLPEATRLAISVAGGVAAVALLSPLFALLTLLVVPPVVFAGRWLARTSRLVYPEYRRRFGVVAGHVLETAEAATTVRAFRAEPRQLDRLSEVNRDVVDGYLAGTSMRNRFYAGLTFTQAFVTAVIVVCASLLAAAGHVTVGTAAAAVLALGAIFLPLTLLVGTLDDLMSARAAAVRVAELAQLPAPPAGTRPLPAGGGALAFAGVSFAYLPGRPVLHDVELAIRPGERFALAGPTGSGKSTIARLAVGLAHPTAGRVSLGDTDLRDIAEVDLRRRLLLIPQESVLVEGTIADNARLVVPDAGDDAVQAAVDHLALRDWVDGLPNGVATDGAVLSTGERQLVALLRVALADPAVVVLDEATSVLDPETEARVARALEHALAGRTVLVVAHRQATAERCDRVGVIRNGRLVEVRAGRDA